MRKEFVLACAFVGLFADRASALAQPPRVPAGKWVIDYQADTCTLSREATDGQAGIAIRTQPLEESHELMLFAPYTGQKNRSFQGRVQIASDPPGAENWAFVERSPKRKHVVLKTTITEAQLSRLNSSSDIRVIGPDGFSLEAALPAMAKPLVSLDECEAYLAGRWGITPAEIKSWARPARATEDLRNLFWDKDRSAVGMLRSGDGIRGVLSIDASGNLADCTIVRRSQVAWVNEKFCATIRQRARFEPAIDATGNRVRGKVITPEIRSARLR